MQFELKPLSEQTIVITGATSGIGLCTARMAANRGANVVAVARNEIALCEPTMGVKKLLENSTLITDQVATARCTDPIQE